MSMHWFTENDDATISSKGLVSALVDVSLGYGMSELQLLSHTRLFYQDLHQHTHMCAAEQVLQLIRNIQGHDLPVDDLCFEVGRQSIHNLVMPLAQAVSHSPSFADAIRLLRYFQRYINPLLCLRTYSDGENYYLILMDRLGTGKQESFVHTSYLCALNCLLQTVLESPQEFRFYIKGDEPENLAYYYKYLSTEVSFGSPFSLIVIPQDLLNRKQPLRSRLAYERYLQECEDIGRQFPQSDTFIENVMAYMFTHILEPEHSLKHCATHFAMSESSLKRKLKKHATSFQALNDQAKSLLALKYLYIDGLSNESVASQLCFNDSTNFRRSFKRWTGDVPSKYKRGYFVL